MLLLSIAGVAGLFFVMGRMAAPEPPPPTAKLNQPVATQPSESGVSTPLPPSLDIVNDEVVATVNDQAISWQLWQQTTRLDAVMSQLAGQSVPTAEETLDRLVNEIIVLNSVVKPPTVNNADVSGRVAELTTAWNVDDHTIDSALTGAGLTRTDFAARVERLMQVEAALANLSEQEANLNVWLTEARANAEISLYQALTTPNPAPPNPIPTEPPTEPDPTPMSQPTPTVKTIVFAPPADTPVSPYPQNAAPDFTLTQLDNQPVTLSHLRGKPAIINFWATWCPPCRRELPALQAAYNAHQDEVGFVAVDVKENQAQVEAFVAELGLTFPIALDTDGQVADVIYEVRGIPTTLFIDANGVVAARHVGPLDEAAINNYLTPLLEAPVATVEMPAEAAINENHTANEPEMVDLPDSGFEFAPNFTLASASGEMVSLSDFKGKQNVALVFYRGHT